MSYANNLFFHATTNEFVIPGREPKVQTNYIPELPDFLQSVTKPLGGFWCTEERHAWKDFALRNLERDLPEIWPLQAERPERSLVWDDSRQEWAKENWGPTFWEDLSKDYDYVIFPHQWVEDNRFNNDLAYGLDIGCVVFLVDQWTLNMKYLFKDPK